MMRPGAATLAGVAAGPHARPAAPPSRIRGGRHGAAVTATKSGRLRSPTIDEAAAWCSDGARAELQAANEAVDQRSAMVASSMAETARIQAKGASAVARAAMRASRPAIPSSFVVHQRLYLATEAALAELHGQLAIGTLETDIRWDSPRGKFTVPEARLWKDGLRLFVIGDRELWVASQRSNARSRDFYLQKPSADAKRERGIGGRHEHPQWSRVLIQLGAKLAAEGLPQSGDGGRARLVEWIAAQFGEDEAPSLTTIQDRLTVVLEAHRLAQRKVGN